MATITNSIRWADNTAELKKNLMDGVNTIDAMKSSVDRLVNTMSGQGLFGQANKTAAAIMELGGVTKLTASEQERANGILERAIEKYKAMGIAAPAAILALHEQTKNAGTATQDLTTHMIALGAAAGSFIGTIGGNLASSAILSLVGGLKSIATALPELALRGAGIADVEENFQHLTSQVGRLGESLMGELRTGTHNTIDDFELMKTVNKDLAAGLNLTDGQFGTLAKGAFALAQATGVDVKSAFDTMNDAMLTGRTRALAMLTGKIDLSAAEEKYAKSLGTTADHLSEEGKLEAARAAILDGVASATQRLGEQTDGLDERVAQAEAAWQNFQDNLGKTIASSPVLAEGLNGIADALGSAFGNAQQDLVTSVARIIDKLAIGVVDLAKLTVQAGVLMSEQWVNVRTQLLLVAEALIAARNPGQLPEFLSHVKAITAEWTRARVEIGTSGAKIIASLDETRSRMVAAANASKTVTSAVKDEAAAHEQAGAGADKHAGSLKKSNAELSAAKSAAEKLAAAEREIASAGSSWVDTLDKMNPATVAQGLALLKAGVGMDAIKTKYNLTNTEAKALASQYDFLNKTLESTNKAFDVHNRIIGLIAPRYSTLHETLTGVDDETGNLSATVLDFGMTKAPVTIDALPRFGMTTGEARKRLQEYREGYQELDGFGKTLNILADGFVRLGQVSGGAFGGLLSQIGQIVVQLETAHKLTQQIGKNGLELGGNWGALSVLMNKNATGAQKFGAGISAAGSVAEGAMNVWDVTDDHKTAWGNAGAGALAGAKAGAAFGPYGMAIGAAAGLIIGLVRGKPEWAKAADDVGRDFGVKISDGLAHAIADKAKTEFGGRRVVAELDALSQIVSEAGGVTAKNFDQLAGKLRDVFPMLQMGWLTSAQAVKILDENWKAFVDAGTDSAGRLNDKLKEMIALDQAMGTQSKEIAAYLQQQGVVAVEGFNAVVAGTASAVVGYDALKKAVDDNTVSGEQHALALFNQAKAGEAARGELSDLGIQAVATYAAMVASGSSASEALKAVGPSLTTLQKSYDDLGLDVDNVALKNLMMQNTITQGNPALLSAIGGLSQEMIALDNMGLLNIDTFAAMERTGLQMYTRLQGEVAKTGGTTRDALVPMQGWLQEAAKQAGLLGIPLDANTAEMIRQSKELGLWKEQGKSAADAVTDSMKKLVDKVSELIDKLNGIPPKVNTTVTTTYENVYTSPPGGDPNDPNYNPYGSTGGFVTAAGIRHFFAGGLVGPFMPTGSDTVPAMLTPGEMVLTSRQQQDIANRLQSASSGPVVDLTEVRKLREEFSALREEMGADRRELPRLMVRSLRDAKILARN